MLCFSPLTSSIGRKKLRIIGSGENLISMTHVDNYCHGLILGEKALYPGSPALGNFYIVTDKEPQKLWKVLDNAFVYLGYGSLYDKHAVPGWLITPVAHAVQAAGYFLNRKFKLNPFAVRMLMIHRWFDISAAERDLGYKPVYTFEEGWEKTLVWFKKNWVPQFDP